jgi:hypothetical protein
MEDVDVFDRPTTFLANESLKLAVYSVAFNLLSCPDMGSAAKPPIKWRFGSGRHLGIGSFGSTMVRTTEMSAMRTDRN